MVHPYLRLLLAVVVTVAASSAHAATFRVGLGGSAGGCTHSRLQEAINAAASRAGPDEIRLVQGYADDAQALTIAGQDLTIRGGYENCGDDDTSALERTYVNGTGGNAASVFDIQGPGVVSLENLFIVGGDPPDTRNGGGIRYVGSSRAGSVNVLSLRETNIEQNNALEGGGIHFSGGGVPAFLELGTGTVIAHNASIFRGGGVMLVGDAHLVAEGERVLFIDNRALDNQFGTANGGALYVEQPASATIGASNHDGFAVFDGNAAAGTGGAIAVASSDPAAPPAIVRVYGNHATRALSMSRNASYAGAAAIAATGVAGPATALVCLRNVNVTDNIAHGGQLLRARGGAHIGTGRVDDAQCGGFPGTAAPCAIAAACNVISGNTTRSIDTTNSGWLIEALDGASVTLRQTTVRDNDIFGCAMRALGSAAGRIGLHDSLVVRNTVSYSDFMVAADGATFDVRHSTIAGNRPRQNFQHIALWAERGGVLDVVASIVQSTHQPITFDPSSTVTIDHALVHPAPAFTRPTMRVGEPRFIAPAVGDFHLDDESPAIDVAPASATSAIDLDGNPRAIDAPWIADGDGRLDLGAYELTGYGFRDGFE